MNNGCIMEIFHNIKLKPKEYHEKSLHKIQIFMFVGAMKKNLSQCSVSCKFIVIK